MAIDIENENVVSLTEATKLLPAINGKRASISTLWRWCRKGLHGVRLDYIRIGRSIATSPEALSRFFTALAEADDPVDEPHPAPPPQRPTDAAKRSSLENAERVLERAGI